MEISAGKMSSLWAGTPTTIRLEDLDVICSVLDCDPDPVVDPRAGQGRGPQTAQETCCGCDGHAEVGEEPNAAAGVSWQSFCERCGDLANVAFSTVKFCFGCWPGGPAVRATVSRVRIDASTTSPTGCAVAATANGHVTIGTCPDCFAWGASTRHRAWRCTACGGWREKAPARHLLVLHSRELPINIYGACRLCTKQRTRVLATKPPLPLPDLIAANRDGQQLWFADMGKAASARRPKSPPPPVAVGTLARFPVTHLQLPLFRFERDLSIARRIGHLGPTQREPGAAARSTRRRVRPSSRLGPPQDRHRSTRRAHPARPARNDRRTNPSQRHRLRSPNSRCRPSR